MSFPQAAPTTGESQYGTLGNSSNLGFKERFWTAADKLRGTMDASEYKHVVLGLIFLKYISDTFEEFHTRLKTQEYADPEDRDEYVAENMFWVPAAATAEKPTPTSPSTGRNPTTPPGSCAR